MKKRLLVMLALATMMLGTTAFAAETELPEAQETEAEASGRTSTTSVRCSSTIKRLSLNTKAKHPV